MGICPYCLEDNGDSPCDKCLADESTEIEQLRKRSDHLQNIINQMQSPNRGRSECDSCPDCSDRDAMLDHVADCIIKLPELESHINCPCDNCNYLEIWARTRLANIRS